MQKSIALYSLLSLVSLLFLTGCGDKGPKLVPASGKVMLDGQEVQTHPNFKGGTVVFTPETGKVSYSNILPNGTFVIKTQNKPGVLPGNYIVTANVNSTEITLEPYNMPLPVSLSAEKYNDTKTSGMTQVVPAGGVKNIVIELTSK